jgi:hypothetical protein
MSAVGSQADGGGLRDRSATGQEAIYMHASKRRCYSMRPGHLQVQSSASMEASRKVKRTPSIFRHS